ncbi:HD domain-containing protein [Roseomonas sp. BN140053]|uniref:HD domain-containing protein n=1 Tax=Roseomonas sp. BN140053 TaxID=3391898 RepID=UPI0039EBD460
MTIEHPAGAPPNWDRLAAATTLAMTLHGGQVRKGTRIPYLAHLLAVSALVLEHGGDGDQAVAGLLHDVVEDCGAEHADMILERFGPRVAGIVRDCTDADTTPKPPWRGRKEAYLRHLETVSPDTLLVSACDKLHNARAILGDLRCHGPAVFGRFTAGQAGTLWYYRALADVFARRLPGRLAQELDDTVNAIEALAERGVVETVV